MEPKKIVKRRAQPAHSAAGARPWPAPPPHSGPLPCASRPAGSPPSAGAARFASSKLPQGLPLPMGPVAGSESRPANPPPSLTAAGSASRARASRASRVRTTGWSGLTQGEGASRHRRRVRPRGAAIWRAARQQWSKAHYFGPEGPDRAPPGVLRRSGADESRSGDRSQCPTALSFVNPAETNAAYRHGAPWTDNIPAGMPHQSLPQPLPPRSPPQPKHDPSVKLSI